MSDDAFYLYGVVRPSVALPARLAGVADATPVVLGDRGVALLASRMPAGHDVENAADLAAHNRVLDAVATADPVVPLRFGTVVGVDDALDQVERCAGEYAPQLGRLDGAVQYTLRAHRRRDDAFANERPVEAERASLLRHARDVREFEVTAPDELFHLAVLVDHRRRVGFEGALDGVGAELSDRAVLHAVGPQAPYDFVTGRPSVSG